MIRVAYGYHTCEQFCFEKCMPGHSKIVARYYKALICDELAEAACDQPNISFLRPSRAIKQVNRRHVYSNDCCCHNFSLHKEYCREE